MVLEEFPQKKSLHELLNSGYQLPKSAIWKIAHGMFSGLKDFEGIWPYSIGYLDKRDFWVGEDYHTKLCLPFARLLDPFMLGNTKSKAAFAQASKTVQNRATRRMPFEQFSLEPKYLDAGAVHTAGILLYEMLTGKPAYGDMQSEQAMIRLKRSDAANAGLDLNQCPEEFREILAACFVKDHTKRPKAADILTLLERMILLPEDKINAPSKPDHKVSLPLEKIKVPEQPDHPMNSSSDKIEDTSTPFEKMIFQLTCPIKRLKAEKLNVPLSLNDTFKWPVTTMQGWTYEYDELKEYLATHNNRTPTGELINNLADKESIYHNTQTKDELYANRMIQDFAEEFRTKKIVNGTHLEDLHTAEQVIDPYLIRSGYTFGKNICAQTNTCPYTRLPINKKNIRQNRLVADVSRVYKEYQDTYDHQSFTQYQELKKEETNQKNTLSKTNSTSTLAAVSMFSNNLKDNSSIQPLQEAASEKNSNHLEFKNFLALYEVSLPLEIPENISDLDQLLVFLKNRETELMSEQDAVKQVLFFEVKQAIKNVEALKNMIVLPASQPCL